MKRIARRRPFEVVITDPEPVNLGPFAGTKGINIMWPFLGPTVVDPGNPSTTYQSNPFTNPSDFVTHVPQTRLNELKTLGFDHVRLNVAPGPWQEAINDPSRVEYLFTLLDPAVDSIIAAGLGCMIDLHPSYYVIYQPTQILAGGTSGPLFTSYKQMLAAFANRYKTKPTNKFMLELFNEPLHSSSISGLWSNYLKQMYDVVRPIMTTHTIGLTMENYSSINELVASNPSYYDSNTYWVVHPYIPAIFSIQGYNVGTYNKYVYGLEWPPNPAQKASIITLMQNNVNADAGVSDKTAMIAAQRQEIDYYFDVPLNKTWVVSELNKVKTWCDTYGIAYGRIIANEYGVTRTNSDYTGAPAASRVAWINDMSEALDAAGFKRSLFALDAPDYGITSGTGSTIGTIDSNIITATRL